MGMIAPLASMGGGALRLGSKLLGPWGLPIAAGMSAFSAPGRFGRRSSLGQNGFQSALGTLGESVDDLTLGLPIASRLVDSITGAGQVMGRAANYSDPYLKAYRDGLL